MNKTPLAASSFFRSSNYIEACLWIAIAWLLLWRFGCTRLAVAAALALVCFGISDIVETRTGAWWRPWWLLVWKGLCIAALAACVVVGIRRKSSS